MRKKVIAIHASSRKRNTYHLLENLREELAAYDIDVEILCLSELDIRRCVGCEVCLRNGTCHLKDDIDAVIRKIPEYDGVILSSPVYMNNVSGMLKTFLDRTCRWVHRPELTGIPMLLVAATAGSGLKNTLNYLEDTALQWGAVPAGKIGRSAGSREKAIEKKEYSRFVEYLNMDMHRYKPGMKELITFEIKKILAEKVLARDKKYWEEKQWLDKPYYFEASIHPLKKASASLFYKFLSGKIKNAGE